MHATLAGHRVNRMGFGAMQLEHTEPAQALAVLRHAVARGINHFDTAEFYTGANALLREALDLDELVIVSKVGGVRVDGRIVAAQKPADLREQVEANLRTLGVERLAVVNVRRMDRTPGILAEGDQLVDVEDQ